MPPRPVAKASPNTFAFETEALVKPSGFREYDARWWFGHPASAQEPELNLIGVQALGMGLATLIRRKGIAPDIVVGHDFRSYSMAIKLALVSGLMAAGAPRQGHRAWRCRRWPISRSSRWTCRRSRWSRPRTTKMAGPASRWAASAR